MPANLPPQYHEAEKSYRAAKTTQEKIKALETMLAIMPKHKGTDKLRAELRRKIAKLSEEAERKYATAKTGGGYVIKREGAGQAILIGPPNVGKSQLLSAITNASPEIADYPFTTQNPTPGMMRFENIQIQIVDMPPITNKPEPWFHNILTSADLLLIVVDLAYEPIEQVAIVIEGLEELRIVAKKALLIGNKNDSANAAQNYRTLSSKYSAEFPLISISAKQGTGLEELKREIYELLGIIRVYTKTPGNKPDFAEPVVLKKGSTVQDAAESIHKDFRNKLKHALLWGSGKFSGQKVKRDHVLQEGDIIELHI